MKTILFRCGLLLLLAMPLLPMAQPCKVTEECNPPRKCDKGLFLVIVADGKKKCATCDQVTLNKLRAKIDECCKTKDEGWTPASSKEYKEALASDKRISLEALDAMIAKADACVTARITREVTCWDGGDQEHDDQLAAAERSLKSIKEHKETMIAHRNIYYCDKAVYEDRLKDYKEKAAPLKLTDLKYALEGYEKKLKAGENIDCNLAEEQQEKCGVAHRVCETLLNDCFKDTESLFPADYLNSYLKCWELSEKLKKVISAAKGKKLCK
jgi:hypothetical protein